MNFSAHSHRTNNYMNDIYQSGETPCILAQIWTNSYGRWAVKHAGGGELSLMVIIIVNKIRYPSSNLGQSCISLCVNAQEKSMNPCVHSRYEQIVGQTKFFSLRERKLNSKPVVIHQKFDCVSSCSWQRNWINTYQYSSLPTLHSPVN